MRSARCARPRDVDEELRLRIRLPVAPGDVSGLCARLEPELARGAARALCDFDGPGEPDLAAVEALARLALLARRHGCTLQLGVAPPCVAELVALAGLGDVLLVR